MLIYGCVLAGSRSSLLIVVGIAFFMAGSQRGWVRIARGLAFTVCLFWIAVYANFIQSTIVAKFVASGSVTHREGAFGSA